MEKRLIDANNAISVLKILSDKCCDDNVFEQAISVLESAPTIDAVEAKHGKWEKGIHMVECSACSKKFDFGDETWVEDYDFCEDIGWNYCPNCGARMDGKEQADDNT